MSQALGLIYKRSSTGSAFHQGEILCDVTEYVLNPGGLTFTPESHPLVLILSQECDLEQDWNARQISPVVVAHCLSSVLMVDASTWPEIRPTITGSDIWKRLRENKDERYQALERVPPEDDEQQNGIEALFLDFKRCFSIPMATLVAQPPQRRSHLVSPYREHLSSRFGRFISRVALPKEHQIESPTTTT